MAEEHYLAMAKIGPGTLPVKINLMAVTVMNAVEKMCAALSVKDTNGLDEFEILRVTEGGKAYIPVASKASASIHAERVQRRNARNTADAMISQEPEPAALDLSYAEPTYIEYEVEAA